MTMATLWTRAAPGPITNIGHGFEPAARSLCRRIEIDLRNGTLYGTLGHGLHAEGATHETAKTAAN